MAGTIHVLIITAPWGVLLAFAMGMALWLTHGRGRAETSRARDTQQMDRRS